MNKNSNKGMYMRYILFMALVLLEAEVMINYPNQWVEIIGIGCLIILSGCLIIAAKIRGQEEAEAKRKEDLEVVENLDKASKASYLLTKKSFQDLDERYLKLESQNLALSNDITVFEHKIQKAMFQLMEEEKKVARVTLNRNKESTNSLMNSYDEMKKKILEFGEKSDDLSERMDILSENAYGHMDEEQYQEILSSIEGLRGYVKSILDQMEDNILESVSETIQKNPGEIAKPDPFMDLEEQLEEDDIAEPEPLIDLASQLEEGIAEPEPLIDLADQLEEGVTNPEPLIDLAGQLEEGIANPEPLIDLAGQLEEGIANPEPLIDLAGQLEEGIANPEPLIDLTAGLESNQDDPNKMMDTDDINALLESINGNEPSPVAEEPQIAAEMPIEAEMPETLETPIIEEEVPVGAEMSETPVIEEVPTEAEVPVIEEAPVEAEKPSTPASDLSDPNKMMGPDDIAALLASMGGNEPEPTASAAAEAAPEPVSEPKATTAMPKPKVAEKPKAEPKVTEKPKAEPKAATKSVAAKPKAAAKAEAKPEPEPVKTVKPDFSDPNKVMSPDEIAALIANM